MAAPPPRVMETKDLDTGLACNRRPELRRFSREMLTAEENFAGCILTRTRESKMEIPG
jgi:hypothetical protein